jgi:hypothetical protein
MNPNKPPEDEPLDALLQEWKVKPPLPPRFNEQVWQRIERSEIAPAISLATAFANWIGISLSRPALAAAYAIVLLAIGSGLGWSQARQETMRVTSDLGARYAQAVDPYQAKP